MTLKFSRKPLRRTPLRRHPKRHVETPAEREARMTWADPHRGWCSYGCGSFSTHLQRHHVLLAQIVKREGGDVWALANSMLLAESRHRRHHDCIRKLPIGRVPEQAVAFAVDLLGEGRATLYFRARYDCTVTL